MLETDRCKLMILQESDYSDVKLLYMSDLVRKYLGGTVEESKYIVRFNDMCIKGSGAYYWVARHKQDDSFIGLVSLDTHHNGSDMEVSYQLMPEMWRMGYATEIVQRIITFSFEELGLSRVVAETQTANEASCRLLERVGMKFEKVVERYGAEQAIYSISNVFCNDI